MITSVSEVSYAPQNSQLLDLEECVEGDFESELGDLLLSSETPQELEAHLMEPIESTPEASFSNSNAWESLMSSEDIASEALVPEELVRKSESLKTAGIEVSLGSVCEDGAIEASTSAQLIPVFENISSAPVQPCSVLEDLLPAVSPQTIFTYVQPQYEAVVVEVAIESPAVQDAEKSLQVPNVSELPEQRISENVERPFDVTSLTEPQPAQSQQPLDVTSPKESFPTQLKSASEPVGAVGSISNKSVSTAENPSAVWLGGDKKVRFTMNTENLGVIDGQIKQIENRITLAIQSPEASVEVLKSHRDVFRVMMENSFGGGLQRADVDISSSQGERGSSFDSRKYDYESSSMWKEGDTVTTPLHPSITNSLIDTYA